MARRFDSGKQIKVTTRKTPHGYLLAEAFPTRTGVLDYWRGGKLVRELRPPEEMVKALDQIARAPVTDVHRKAGPEDLAHFEGLLGHDVVLQDDGWVRTTVQVMAAKAIKDIEEKRRQKLSGGFDRVRFDATPGNWDPTSQTYRLAGSEPPEGFVAERAVPFDGIQRDLEFSHAMLCRASRAGDGARVRYDQLNEDDGMEVDEGTRYDVIKKVKGKYYVYSESGKKLGGPYNTREEALKRLGQVEHFNRQDEKEKIMPRINIDGIDFEVEDALAVAIRDDREARHDELRTVQESLDDFKGQIKALTEERDGLKGQVTALEAQRHDEPDQAALTSRLKVLATARKVGVDYLKKSPLDCSKTDTEIMRDAVAKRYDSVNVKEASEAEVAGMFKVLQAEEPARYDDLLDAAEAEGTPKATEEDDMTEAYDQFCKNMDTPRLKEWGTAG